MNREYIDATDDETFAKWMGFHLATCKRQDLIGASHHTLDILQKKMKDRHLPNLLWQMPVFLFCKLGMK